MTGLILTLLRRRVAQNLKPSIQPPQCQGGVELAEACDKLIAQMEVVGRASHRTQREADELARLCAGLYTRIAHLKCRANVEVRHLTE